MVYGAHYFTLGSRVYNLSLKSLIPSLAERLEMSPAALYERQRALVRAGLLHTKGGRGPGSGVRATPESVAMLLIAIIATDNLSEVEKSTKLFAGLRADGGVCKLTGKKTFASVLDALLASKRHVRKIEVDRGSQTARIDYFEAHKEEDFEGSTSFHSAKFKAVVPVNVTAELLAYFLDPVVNILRGET
jgi:hypothetical protein